MQTKWRLTTVSKAASVNTHKITGFMSSQIILEENRILREKNAFSLLSLILADWLFVSVLTTNALKNRILQKRSELLFFPVATCHVSGKFPCCPTKYCTHKPLIGELHEAIYSSFCLLFVLFHNSWEMFPDNVNAVPSGNLKTFLTHLDWIGCLHLVDISGPDLQTECSLW